MDNTFIVRVLDPERFPLAQASVEVSYAGSDSELSERYAAQSPTASYDEDLEGFLIEGLELDKFEFRVSLKGYEKRVFMRYASDPGWEIEITLFEEGADWFPMGTGAVRIPKEEIFALRAQKRPVATTVEEGNTKKGGNGKGTGDQDKSPVDDWEEQFQRGKEELEAIEGISERSFGESEVPELVFMEVGGANQASDKQKFVEQVNKSDFFELVGPVLVDGENIPMTFSGFLTVFLTRDVDLMAFRSQFEGTNWIPLGDGESGSIHLQYDGEGGHEMLHAFREVGNMPNVRMVEPAVIVPEILFVVPTDSLYQYQWYYTYLDFFNAWLRLQNLRDVNGNLNTLTFGSADVILTVYDTGVASAGPINNAAPTHPDFIGTVNGGAMTAAIGNNNKVYRFLDSTNLQLNNNAVAASHGTGCSGVATALANHADGNPGQQGVVGAAPNARLLGAFWPNGQATAAWNQTFQWLAGLPVSWTMANFPAAAAPPIVNLNNAQNPPTDIISNSWGRNVNIQTTPTIPATMRQLRDKGRNSRGSLVIFAAGNGDRLMFTWGGGATGSAYQFQETVMAIAACSLAANGEEERSSYSHYGNVNINNAVPQQLIDNGIDVSAPSHHYYIRNNVGAGFIDHNPPLNYGAISADLLNQGNLPNNITVNNQLNGAVAPNAAQFTLNNAAGFAAGMAAIIEPANNTNFEGHMIAAPVGNTIGINNLGNRRNVLEKAHANNTAVSAGPAHNKDDFGGTSSSCPTTAGIAALVKSANPALTGVEIRDILRRTALPIDIRLNSVFGGVNLGWVDAANNPVVNANGQLILGATQTTISTAIPASPVGAVTETITVANTAGFQLGQAILIGAESVLNANSVAASPTINVTRAGDFTPGRVVHINHGFKTHLAAAVPYGMPFFNAMVGSPPNPPATPAQQALISRTLFVGNTKGLAVNHWIRIGGPAGELVQISAILSSSLIRLFAAPVNAHNLYDEIVLDNQRNRTIAPGGVNGGANTITFNTNVGFAYNTVGTPPIWITQEDTEIRIIKGINAAANQLIIDPLRFPKQVGTTVTGGLIPYYSNAVGFGRVQPEVAVRAAIDYQHNGRDLMVRDFIGDTGVGNPPNTPINSPDVWSRNAAGAGPPVAWGVAGPHQKPSRTGARWATARYANRGNGVMFPNTPWASKFAGFPTPDYSVHIYLCLKPDNQPIVLADYQQTLVPAGVNVWNNYSAFNNSNLAGTQLIGSTSGQLGGARLAYPANGFGNLNTTINWAQNIMPNLSTMPNNFNTYLLFEVTPHDGLQPDSSVRGNNNISYKKIDFWHTVTFLDAAGANPLIQSIPLSPNATPVTTPFRIRINDIPNFNVNNITISVTLQNINGPNETVNYTWNGTAWQTNINPTNNWLTLNPPLLTATNVATAGMQNDIYFPGSFTVNNASNGVTITATIPDAHPNPFGGLAIPFNTIKTHQVVLYTDHPYNETFSIVPSRNSRFHTWTNMALLQKQTAANAFGPSPANPTNIFNLTSLFTATTTVQNNNTPVPAYAMTSGYVFIQPITGDNTRINLILKPLRQPKIGFTPIKYIVYRGLTLTDFLQGPSPNDNVAAGPGASPFMQFIHQVFQQRAADAGVAPGQLLSSTLGWDPTNQPLIDPIDKYFYSSNPQRQLPIVTMGMQLGTFVTAANAQFGIEIILEEGSYRPTLAFARRASYNIDFTLNNPGGPLATRAAREEILNFIDPAAYIGMHWTLGLEQPGGNPAKTGQTLYTDEISQYATCNKRYIDIRSENGYSYNYYQNYLVIARGTSTGNISVGPNVNNLTAQTYGTSSWPLVILNENNFQTEDQNINLDIQVKIDDNVQPVFYSVSGELTSTSTQSDRWVDSNLLLPGGGAAWTNSLVFTSPTIPHPTNSPLRIPVAEWIKGIYARRSVNAPVWPASVIPTNNYLDNLFGPVDGLELMEPGAQDIEWINAQDQRFVDGGLPTNNFAYIADRGIAYEQNRVVFYAVGRDFLQRRTKRRAVVPNGITTGLSSRGNFFEVASIFQDMDIKVRNINPGNPPTSNNWIPIQILEFQVGKRPVLPESVMILGITEGEYNQLQGLPGFDPSHERNLTLIEIFNAGNQPLKDRQNKTYRAFSLGVHGYNAAGNFVSPVPQPVPNIIVYSLDGYVFSSQAFAAQQPLPASYTPTAEETLTTKYQQTVDQMISADPTAVATVNNFAAAVGSVTNDVNALTNLTALATNFGLSLWNDSVNFVQNNNARDERPLYWARLKMQILLNSHPYCEANPATAANIAQTLEDYSRGLFTLDTNITTQPANTKIVLLLGFDPYNLDHTNRIQNRSSSAAAVMNLDGTFTAGATNLYIRSAILPIRYQDFDRNFLETHFGNMNIFTNNLVDAVITIGPNGTTTRYEVDRIASRLRKGGIKDNNADKRNNSRLPVANPQEFYDTDLPVGSIVPGGGNFNGSTNGQTLFYDQSYRADNGNHADPDSGGNNSNANAYPIGNLTGRSKLGSAQGFLYNEAYYRLAHLRSTTAGTTVQVGHFSVPDPVGNAMNPVVQFIQTMILNGLPGY